MSVLHRVVLRDDRRSCWLDFTAPVAVLEARTTDEVVPLLAEIERRVQGEQLTAAGFVSYEAAPAFDPALETRTPSRVPLACFGLFADTGIHARLADDSDGGDAIRAWRIDTAKADYLANIARIRQQIAEGNVYQVNYTIRAVATGITDAWQFFLRTASDAPYAAYIDCGSYAIASASPELFFRLQGLDITSRPMKGTAARGLSSDHDAELRRDLLMSAKDRAENVMIADMIRNDIGRIALPGSVSVSALCQVEKYATVWQLTSTVQARTPASVAEIFAALFPCASITGAPKVASMRLLSALETSPRQVYTGAIGYIAPGRQAQFSVAIRTAFIDKMRAAAGYGIGGGIVWDSDAADEYDECLAKARILYLPRRPADFRLLETLLWTAADGYFLLDRHLRRMQASADYFDFAFDRSRADECLRGLASQLAGARHRVRLLLHRRGQFDASETPIAAGDLRPQRLRLADQPVDAGDVFLYHKTTHRDRYDQALARAGDCDDVLLWNGDGYITETSIANVVVRFGDDLVTPAVDCGLLAGTCRQWLLDAGTIVERNVRVSELAGADEIKLVNSVRGLYPARLARAALDTSGTV